MPVLRSAKSKRLFPPLMREPSVRSMHSSFRSTHSLGNKNNFSKTTIKSEPISPTPSNTEINEITKVLDSAPSEAKFFSEICEEELKKLMKERELLNNKIQVMINISKRKDTKNTEAARIVKKLWDTNKKGETMKSGRLAPRTAVRKLAPTEVKRIFEEAKKNSNHLKLKRKLLIARKQRVESKIHLAIETIKFCRKFIRL